MKNLLAMFVLLMGASLLVPVNAAKAKQAPPPTVAGKWHFVLDTPGGDRNVDAEFKQDADQVSGKWGTADVKGTFADGKLNLEFAFTSDEAGSGTMKIKGALTDGALSGDWAFADYSGSFKATRAKE